MRAAALNARDNHIVHGHYPVPHGLPLVPLSDGVGEVVEVGAGTTRVKVGDRVAGIFAQRWLRGPRDPLSWASTLGGDLDGVLRELVTFSEEGVVPVPEHLTDVEAATLPTAAVTAWQSLFISGQVNRGQDVLVLGSGGVALFALQFARQCGARVIVASRSPAKAERLRELGAAAVVDASLPDWPSALADLTRGQGVDHVVEVVGDLNKTIPTLRIGGTISLIGDLGGDRFEGAIVPFLLANATLRGVSVGPRSTFELMNEAIARHRLRPVIDSVHPFAQASQAFRRLDEPTRFGKVVITFQT